MSTLVDPSQTPPSRRSRSRHTVATAIASTLVLGTGGYGIACAAAPIPAPTIEPAQAFSAAEQRFGPAPTAPQAAVDAQTLPTAVTWLERPGAWANDATAYPIASLTKLVTALVCQEAAPLEPGSEGFTHVWSADDAALQQGFLANDGIVYPTPLGTQMTQRQMLTIMLLPSANDYAAAYATAVFGSNDAFVAAVDDWTARHALDSVRLVEPSGMDPGNVAAVADLAEVARLVLDDPALAEIVGLPEADIPWGDGHVESTNPLIRSLPDITGLKTGTLDVIGFNYLVSQRTAGADRSVMKIVVALARGSNEERAADGARLLAEIETFPETIVALEEGDSVGTAVTVDGQRIPLIAGRGSSAVLLPGEEAVRTSDIGEVQPGPTEQAVGTVRVDWPDDVAQRDLVPIVTTRGFEAPTFWWRVSHPFDLFG